MHDDRSRLREALAAALGAAQDAHAPQRVLALLQGAYRSLESAQFVDADMMRWAEASLGAWRRWSATVDAGEHRLLVVDPADVLGEAVRAALAGAQVGAVRVVATRSATLEALATQPPTAILFDLDSALAPTLEMLEWLSTEFPQIRRIGCTATSNSVVGLARERALYDAIIERPPTGEALRHALRQPSQPHSSHG